MWTDDFRALVIGASGGIGSAFVQALQAHPSCARVQGISRHSEPAVDYASEDSVVRAAEAMRTSGPWHLIVVATGLLHTPHFQPEKRLAELRMGAMEEMFRINTFGPALVLRHFAPLLDRQRSVMALLSAKVGSIGDNRLGGWYSYRASKAALNMMVKTAAIELRRTHPGAVLTALHPGTVATGLSRPFRGDEVGRTPQQAVSEMLQALQSLRPEDSGRFTAYDGRELPW